MGKISKSYLKEVAERKKYQSGGFTKSTDSFSVKKSTIPGANNGLFSNTPIRKGRLIGLAHENNQPVGILGNMHNHSENPNMYSVKIGNQRYLYADKDITPGDELTTNYRFQPELEQPESFSRNIGNKRFGQIGMKASITGPTGSTNNSYIKPITSTPLGLGRNVLQTKPIPSPSFGLSKNITNIPYTQPVVKKVDPRATMFLQSANIMPTTQAEKDIAKMRNSFNNYENAKPAPNKVLKDLTKQKSSRSLTSMIPNFIPVVNDIIDYRDIVQGMHTGNTTQMNQGILGVAAPGLAGKGIGEMLDYVTEKNLDKEFADDMQKKREDIVNMGSSDLQKLYTKYGPGGYDKWKAAGFPKLQMGGTIGIPGVNGQVVSSGPQPLSSVKKTRGSVRKDNKGNVKTMSPKAVNQVLKYSKQKPNKI